MLYSTWTNASCVPKCLICSCGRNWFPPTRISPMILGNVPFEPSLNHESLYEKEAYLDYTTEEAFPTTLAWDQPDFFEREVWIREMVKKPKIENTLTPKQKLISLIFLQLIVRRRLFYHIPFSAIQNNNPKCFKLSLEVASSLVWKGYASWSLVFHAWSYPQKKFRFTAPKMEAPIYRKFPAPFSSSLFLLTLTFLPPYNPRKRNFDENGARGQKSAKPESRILCLWVFFFFFMFTIYLWNLSSQMFEYFEHFRAYAANSESRIKA